jgi:hypothetical protein
MERDWLGQLPRERWRAGFGGHFALSWSGALAAIPLAGSEPPKDRG